MAPILKGIVVIAVEDDAILMIHGTVELVAVADGGTNRWECHDVRYSDLYYIERPFPATGDGLVAENPDQQGDLDEWRKHTPTLVRDYILEFIGGCIEDGKAVDAVGVSIFGNINIQSFASSYVNNAGDGDGKYTIEPIYIPTEIKKRYGTHIHVCVENDATAMTFGEALRNDRRDVLSAIWMGRGINAGIANTYSYGRKMGSWKGKMHPEMGHIFPRIHDRDYDYHRYLLSEDLHAKCVVHKDCINGLAGRRSILERKINFGFNDRMIVEVISYYMAQLCVIMTLVVVPARIVIGGYTLRSGLIDSEMFIQAVRDKFNDLLNGYPIYGQNQAIRISDFIQMSKNGDLSALRGMTEVVKIKLVESQMAGERA